MYMILPIIPISKIEIAHNIEIIKKIVGRCIYAQNKDIILCDKI